MATSVIQHGTPSSSFTLVNTDCDETEDVMYSAGNSTIQSIEINNTANSAATYVKLNNASDNTPGTTEPAMVFVAPASSSITYVFPVGVSSANRIVLWAVTTAGTPGSTGPTSAVTTRILIQV